MDQGDDMDKDSKIKALRRLRDMNFYNQKEDNPENLDLDADENPEHTMQDNPSNLLDALKRKKEKEMMDNLFKNGQ